MRDRGRHRAGSEEARREQERYSRPFRLASVFERVKVTAGAERMSERQMGELEGVLW